MDEHDFLPSPDDGLEEQTKRIARVDVRGKDPALWTNLRSKLAAKVIAFLDTTVDHNEGTTIREEAKQMTSALLDYARNKLAREGVEVQKVEAEISEIYANRAKSLAETEKTAAEAEAQRQRNAAHELCMMLALTKIVLVGEEGEEALLLGQQIDTFLEVVKEMGLISGV